jgi:hypothetical protein
MFEGVFSYLIDKYATLRTRLARFPLAYIYIHVFIVFKYFYVSYVKLVKILLSIENRLSFFDFVQKRAY